MNARSRLLALGSLVLLAACHSALATYPELRDPDERAVIGFLDRYKSHDIDGMMAYLEDDAEFQGSDSVLNKPQIRSFLLESFEKHPGLRIEFGPPRRVRATLQVNVRLENDIIASATWVFILRNHRIHTYSIRPSGAP